MGVTGDTFCESEKSRMAQLFAVFSVQAHSWVLPQHPLKLFWLCKQK